MCFSEDRFVLTNGVYPVEIPHYVAMSAVTGIYLLPMQKASTSVCYIHTAVKHGTVMKRHLQWRFSFRRLDWCYSKQWAPSLNINQILNYIFHKFDDTKCFYSNTRQGDETKSVGQSCSVMKPNWIIPHFSWLYSNFLIYYNFSQWYSIYSKSLSTEASTGSTSGLKCLIRLATT